MIGLLCVLLLVTVNSHQDNSKGHIIFIRHCEKTNKAKTGDVHLNQRCQIRAAALALFFFPKFNDDMLSIGKQLPPIGEILVQSATHARPSRREIETGRFIADAGGIPMTEFDHDDFEGIKNFLWNRMQINNVLVVWDHSTIGHIASQLLGPHEKEVVQWPKNRYDVIWLLDPVKKTLLQHCQSLLYGDSQCSDDPLLVHPKKLADSSVVA